MAHLKRENLLPVFQGPSLDQVPPGLILFKKRHFVFTLYNVQFKVQSYHCRSCCCAGLVCCKHAINGGSKAEEWMWGRGVLGEGEGREEMVQACGVGMAEKAYIVS